MKLKNSISEIPASYHQERLWFIDSFEKGVVYSNAPIYHNIPVIVRLSGSVDMNRLRRSIDEVVEEHEILRTRLVQRDGKPFQLTSPLERINLSMIDLTDSFEHTDINRVVDLAVEESKVPFDLENDLLLRAVLYKVSASENVLLLVVHHLVCDSRSVYLMVNEIVRNYQLPVVEHAAPSLQYSDFSQWQAGFPATAVESSMLYWRREFSEKNEDINLPIEHPRQQIHIFSGVTMKFTLNGEFKDRLNSFSRREGVTPDVPLLAMFKILLHRYTGQNELTVGVLSDNRVQPGTDKMIGPLANLLAVKSVFQGTSSFYTFYRSLLKKVGDSNEHRQLPFEKLVLELGFPNDMSRTALFDVLFQYDNEPVDISVTDDLHASIIDTNLGWGKYDLNLKIKDGDDLQGILTYNHDLFSEKTIRQIITSFQSLAVECVANPNVLFSNIDILGHSEKTRLLKDFNYTAPFSLGEVSIHEMFRRTVRSFPGRDAVKFGGKALTYKELDDRSENLARVLRNDYGVVRNEFVGVLVKRSESIIVCILAILKSGGAYVPIDPEYPSSRISYMLNDSRCRLLVTENNAIEKSFSHACKTIFLDKITNILAQPVTDVVEEVNQASDTAYVIYTSGTTGNPKGCMVTHANVVSLMNNSRELFHFHENDIWVVAHSFCFDFSTWEIYGAFFYGGKLIVPDVNTIRDLDLFLDLIKQERVTVLNQTPAAFNALAELEVKKGTGSLADHLRFVIFGGDKLIPASLKKWVEHYSLRKMRLINMYGITETTVHVTFHEIIENDIENSDTTFSPIGRPLPGVKVYILDQYMNIVPIGVTGEFYVGGCGVSNGYWSKGELTRARFIENPHVASEIIYKAGDIGKWNHNGQLEFKGRNDKQVKIRGFRIELGEIERKLNSHIAVEKGVVLALNRIDGDKYLVAYAMLKNGCNVSEVRNYLKASLPEYMVPPFIVQVGEFPLTFNKKIDYKALEALPISPPTTLAKDAGDGPRNHLQRQLVDLWSEILKSDSIGVTDNFFDIGGHSLKATRIVSGVHRLFNVKLDLKTIFLNPTIEALSKIIEESDTSEYRDIPRVPDADYYEASNAQKRLWLANQFSRSGYEYNVPNHFEVKGELHPGTLESALRELVDRHEILRTTFLVNNDTLYQKITKLDEFVFSLDVIDEKRTVDAVISEFSKRPFDLVKGPLFRCQLIRKSDGYIFSLVLHHIISDAWSIEILFTELLDLYESRRTGVPSPLGRLPIQYRDFAAWHNANLNRVSLSISRLYWLSKINGESVLIDLPYDRPSESNQAGGSIGTYIDSELFAVLGNYAKQKGTTYFTLLLASIQTLLFRYTGAVAVVVGSPVAGRTHHSLSGQIGYYANTLLFKTLFKHRQSFDDVVSAASEDVLESQKYGDYPYDMLVEELRKHDPTPRPVLFNVGFTWHSSSGAMRGSMIPEKFTVKPYRSGFAVSLTDLWFHGFETGDGLGISLDYNKNVFDEDTVAVMLTRLKSILKVIETDPHTDITEIRFSESCAPADTNFSIALNI